MTVALDYSLMTLNTATLIIKADYDRIEDGRVNGSSECFIGQIVTRYGQTFPDIVGCDETQPLTGILIGINTTRHTLPNVTSGNAAFYYDYDNMFPDNTYVRIGIMKSQGVYLVLSDTNKTFAVGDGLKVADGGVLAGAGSGDVISFIAEEVVTGASNTRKYFRARFIKNV